MDQFINKMKSAAGIGGQSEPEPTPQVSPEDMKTKLLISNGKLKQQENMLTNQRVQYRDEAKNSLKRGDDRGYKSASRRFGMISSQLNTVSGMADMSQAMLDAVELQGNMSEIMELGDSLNVLQNQMGLNSGEVEKAVMNIRASMENVTRASSTLTTTMDAALQTQDEFDINDTLKAELMAEIQGETVAVNGFGETIDQRMSE